MIFFGGGGGRFRYIQVTRYVGARLLMTAWVQSHIRFGMACDDYSTWHGMAWLEQSLLGKVDKVRAACSSKYAINSIELCTHYVCIL